MATEDEWKTQLIAKLFDIFGPKSENPNVNGLTGLLAFLDMTDFEYQQEAPGSISPFWRSLRAASRLNADSVLQEYAQRIMKDAEEYKNDPNFLASLAKIYENMVDPNDEDFEEALTTFKDIAKLPLEEHRGSTLGVGMALARVWDALTPSTKMEIVQVVKTVVSNYRALSCIDECVSLVNKTGGTVAMVGLAVISLTWQCFLNLRRWWNGEISGVRCTKNCVDSIVEISGGIGGGLAGAAVGSMILPGIGTAIGGILGGLISGAVAKILTERLTLFIFDLPKDEALEKAYDFLGVHHKSSNDVVNKAFRAKALKFHPDKGGKVEDFYQLQFQMAVIKMARGEHF